MPLDLNKPITTRNGGKVRILCTDADCSSSGYPQPIVGLVEGMGTPAAWSLDGSFNTSRPGYPSRPSYMDLVNVPPSEKTYEVNVRLFRDQRGIYAVAAVDEEARPRDCDYIILACHNLEFKIKDTQP